MIKDDLNIVLTDHILIKDTETDEIILNKNGSQRKIKGNEKPNKT